MAVDCGNLNFNSINEKNLEQCVVTFLEKVDSMENARTQLAKKSLPTAQIELRTLQLWRCIISECLASFLYVFIVCGAAATSAHAGSFPQTSFVTAAASGFTVCVLTYCFQNLSGAHINPAISVSMIVSRKVSPLRGLLFVTAQSGGAIAGAALLYGVTNPAQYGYLNATVALMPEKMTPWGRICIEFMSAFLVVFTYCVTMHGHRKWLGSSAMCMGLAYLATGLVSMPTQNPVRAFGPAFVMNKWEYHWVFWFGPCIGGVVASVVFEVIFITHRKKSRSDMSVDGDSTSIHSEADTYDDLGKSRVPAMRPVNPHPYLRQVQHQNTAPENSYCSSFYPMSMCKAEREPIYEGSRSMYTRSPPLTRANLNRSQSVYSKNTVNAGGPPHVQPSERARPAGGPLYPAQSLYPMPTSNSTPVRQNQQNQQRQSCTENPYDTKPTNRDIYGKVAAARNADYGYSAGVVKKQQDSSDNTYNSFISSSSGSGSKIPATHHIMRKDGAGAPDGPYYHKQQSPNGTGASDGSYYHKQPSPNSHHY